jgi:hypothetical protein
MFSKTKIALSAAIVLSTAFAASAATKHHRSTQVHPVIYDTARSDQYPVLDVNPVCHGIADQSDLEAGLRATNFDQCVQTEQATRQELIKEWSNFTSDDKAHCVAETTMGGESSYTELVTCLEMARDVRELHSKGNISSAPAQQVPPAPAGHRQPTQ